MAVGVLPMRSAETFRVLPAAFNADKEQQMMRAWLRGQVHAALDRRLQDFELALASPGALQKYQRQRRDFWRWTLGDFPERSSLNPRKTGMIREDGFTIEKLLFQSRPGFFVTANVYRPEGAGPFPAILHPCGHSENGKAYEAYQRANRLLVRHGFIVLCYDPIGQGERKQILDAAGKPVLRGSAEHQQLGVAPILLGSSLGAWMVWDGVRAIDYLCGRPDVDAGRIGCTGNSGGGNLTSFLMAYDDRIVAAAPGCFMTTHRRKNESPGPGDAEQNLFAQIREGFDHPDFIITRAPQPTLILSATRDFVPIEGTWEAFRQAKRAYTVLGHPERIQLIEADERHGFTRRLREGAVRFFARWLQDRQIEVFEPEAGEPVLSDAELQVTPEGQVLQLPGAGSALQLYAEEAERLAQNRALPEAETIRRVAGIRRPEEMPQPKVEVVAEDVPRKLLIRPEPGIVLPALHWPGGTKEPVLMVPDQGMNSAVTEARRLHGLGHPVLVVEARDTGETKTRNWRFFGADYSIAYMLGRSWLGMWTEDLLVSARWLAGKSGTAKVHLVAEGELVPAALHAVAQEPGLVARLDVRGGLNSWRSLMTDPEAHRHIHNAVPGALSHYDLPDLVRMAGEGQVRFERKLP